VCALCNYTYDFSVHPRPTYMCTELDYGNSKAVLCTMVADAQIFEALRKPADTEYGTVLCCCLLLCEC